MTCPECGERSRVTETREIGAGLRRRRRCANGHRFTSHEVVTEGAARLRSAAVIVPITRIRELHDWIESVFPKTKVDGEV